MATNISVIDEYHRSIITDRPFAQVYPIGVQPVVDEPAEDVSDDEDVKAKVVRKPGKAVKASATEEGVETK